MTHDAAATMYYADQPPPLVQAVVDAAQHAIDRAEAGAAPEWLAAARAAIRLLASVNDTFVAGDVWGLLDAYGVPAPAEPRAMGAAMRAAYRAGEIVRAGGYRTGTRVQSHGRPEAVWTRKGRPR